MGDVFTPLDLVIFFAALVGVMVVGLIAGRKEETTEDYFLAGRGIPWWGVAGSIFGSNVSANHMVGMMGIGFSIGFAQSHFELGAIFGLMALCYGFLPVYRKLRLYTLSEYLERRYDERSRVAYAVIMVIIMAMVQMVPGLYIGARSICVLLGGEALKPVTATVEQHATATSPSPPGRGAGSERDSAPAPAITKLNVDRRYYAAFVIALAAIAAGYTIFGGLKAVVWTDVVQSILLLAAGIVVAVLTFHKIGGWGEMMALDRLPSGADKMHLYLPSSDKDLPWTGVFTGLMAMHCFYWGTNQFIVQRALAAKSDNEARLGIVAAGFLKLLIPFFAIGTGVAAYYLFQVELPNRAVDPDAAFSELVKLVIPVGTGIVGLIAAGLIGAILSSIDSMMNSAATIVTVDVYQRYLKPDATDRQMILVGRVSIAVFVVLAAALAILVLNPNSEENFFLQIVDYQGYLTPGLLVAFFLGMFWRRATAAGGFAAIIAGILYSGIVQYGYDTFLGTNPNVAAWLGEKLNFFHRVVGVLLLCGLTHVIVSLCTRPDDEKARLVWTDLGGHAAHSVRNVFMTVLISLCVFGLLGWAMVEEQLSPTTAGLLAGLWTLSLFILAVRRALKKQRNGEQPDTASEWPAALLQEDRFWAGVLCALAVFMHYYFY